MLAIFEVCTNPPNKIPIYLQITDPFQHEQNAKTILAVYAICSKVKYQDCLQQFTGRPDVFQHLNFRRFLQSAIIPLLLEVKETRIVEYLLLHSYIFIVGNVGESLTVSMEKYGVLKLALIKIL